MRSAAGAVGGAGVTGFSVRVLAALQALHSDIVQRESRARMCRVQIPCRDQKGKLQKNWMRCTFTHETDFVERDERLLTAAGYFSSHLQRKLLGS